MLKSPKLPPSISGDGKIFVDTLVKYLDSIKTYINDNVNANGSWQVKNTQIQEVWGEVDGVITNQLVITFDPSNIQDYIYSEIYQIDGDNIFFIDTAVDSYTISNIEDGVTYNYKIIAVNKFGIRSSFSNAPILTYHVTSVRETISSPKNPAIIFDRHGGLIRWDHVSDTDFLKYEVRTNTNIGEAAGLLTVTVDNSTTIIPNTRTGTVYIYTINQAGYYSYPSIISYNKPVPSPPKMITFNKLIDKLIIQVSELPDDCIGVTLYLDNNTVFIESSIYEYTSLDPLFTVRAAYTDIFGTGMLSETYIVQPPEITDLWLDQDIQRQKDGTIIPYIFGRCIIPNGVNEATIEYSEDNGTTWYNGGRISDDGSFALMNVKCITYLVRIKATNAIGYTSYGIVKSIFVTGKNNPPSDVSGFTAKEVNGGFLLTWLPNIDTDINGYNIFYGINNAGIDLCEEIAHKLHSTSLYVPISSAGKYIFYIQAEDNSGNKSNFVSIEATFTLPPSISGFDVIKNGDYLVFKWNNVDIIGARYEIRRGTSYDTAERICITTDTLYNYFFPVPGEHIFWIKALDQLGNYSKTAASTSITIPFYNNRNTIYTIDQVNGYTPWEGNKINCSIYNGGLKLNSTSIYGEHIIEVNLQDNVMARNWILSNVIGTVGDELDWGSANFIWDSLKANTAWIPDGDTTTILTKYQLSRFIGFNNNIIESFSLDESVVGEKAGTIATEAIGITYQDARFRKGVKVDDTTKLSWDINIPSQFSLTFCVRVSTAIVDHVVYMVLISPNAHLEIGYNPLINKFYLNDGLGNKNEISIDFDTQDIITFGIVQTSTIRRFMAKTFSIKEVAIDEKPFLPLGEFNHIALYPM